VKNKILQIFREASEFAFNREVISLAMYRKSKIYLEYIVNQEKPKARVYRIWTHEQYDKFISTFKENDKYRPLFRWMFFSGARIGETCALQWKDFDAEKKTIHIYKTASARIGIGKSVIMTTKTRAGDRFILLNEQMFNDIMDLKVAFGENPESFLFFGYEEPIGHTTIRTVFNNHIRLAGLPRIKIHEIRHTNNTWLLDENQSRAAADIVTKRLGRSSLKVTLDTYYHSNPVVEESIVEKIKI
jgi:integrase